MASRLTTLQSERHTLTQEREQLRAQISTLLADTSTTEEQLTAHQASITAKDAEIAAKDAQISQVQALLQIEAQAPAVTTHRQPLSATPRAEDDPRRGYRTVGEYARDVKAWQDSSRNGVPMDSRTMERLSVVMADTRRFAAEEAAEYARFGAAAPTPLHQEGNSTDGLMVPVDFRQEIWKPTFENDDLLPFFNPQTTSSRVVQFAADETTPWGAAGIKAYWTAEGAQKTPSRLSLAPREVHLHKIAALVYSTDELLQDTALLTARINEAAPRAIGWEVTEAFIRGDGVGKPRGIENSPAIVVVAKETNQKAGTIYTENVLNMASRINEGPGSRLLWLAHRSTIPSIATLKIGNEPSWTNQNQGLREAPNGMLLGVPVKFTQHARFRGTQGDLTLIDFSGYAAFVHSSGTKFDSSIHLYFDYDITAFRWVFRVGGMPILSAAIAQANGSETVSHFVQLATRA